MKTKYMLKMVLFLMVILSFSAEIFSQDTFSIVAVDTVTGEIGSADVSCVGPFGGVGAFILSDLIEGIGGIHTQALLRRGIKVIRLRKSLTNSNEERLFS